MGASATLLIMTLNEEVGMREILPKIDRSLFTQIIVVDGGSRDRTVELAKSEGLEVHIQERSGLKNAYIEVFPKIKGDIVVCFSPDGNSLPEALSRLLNKMDEGYDMVIASRYLDSAKSEDDDYVTAFGNWLFTSLINLIYGTKYTDAMVMYRAFKKEVFFSLDLDKDKSYWPERFLFTDVCIMPLFSMRAGTLGLKTAEIPADEPKRIGGERKLQVIRWGMAYMIQLFTDRFIWKGRA